VCEGVLGCRGVKNGRGDIQKNDSLGRKKVYGREGRLGDKEARDVLKMPKRQLSERNQLYSIRILNRSRRGRGEQRDGVGYVLGSNQPKESINQSENSILKLFSQRRLGLKIQFP